MPAPDKCRPQVVRALEKTGCHVEPFPYAIPVENRAKPLLADIVAKRGTERIIVVEVKCFEGNVPDEVYTAIGQYLVYRSLMQQQNIHRPLYLAVPANAYDEGTFSQLGLSVVKEAKIKLIIVDLESEEIVQWLE